MEDEIINELRQIKEDIAKEHGYDAKKLVAHLQGKSHLRPEPKLTDIPPHGAEQIVRVDQKRA